MGEVVEDVALRPRAKEQETRDTHHQTHEKRDRSGIVGHPCKSIQCWFLEGAVDQQAVMVFDTVSLRLWTGNGSTYDKRRLA